MKKFLPLERLALHLCLTYLSLYASFLLLYGSYFSSMRVAIPFIVLLVALLISTVYALLLQRGMAVSAQGLTIRGESLPWESVERLYFTKQPLRGISLVVQTSTLHYRLSQRQLQLWGDTFITVVPPRLQQSVAPIFEQRNLYSFMVENVIGKAESSIAPLAIFSLTVGSLVWQVPLVWCFIFAALVVVMPVLWAITLIGLALLFPSLLHRHFSQTILLLSYLYLCLFLAYGTLFRMML